MLEGQEITAESLVAALGRIGMNKIGNIARHNMDSVTKGNYQRQTDQEKRAWLAQYVVEIPTLMFSVKSSHNNAMAVFVVSPEKATDKAQLMQVTSARAKAVGKTPREVCDACCVHLYAKFGHLLWEKTMKIQDCAWLKEMKDEATSINNIELKEKSEEAMTA